MALEFQLAKLLLHWSKQYFTCFDQYLTNLWIEPMSLYWNLNAIFEFLKQFTSGNLPYYQKKKCWWLLDSTKHA